MAAYASDAGHWYTRTGEPCYTLIGKNKKERNTTLRDARKLDLVPSVTEILKITAKPALVRWQLEQLKLSCLTLPKIPGETIDQFSKRVDHDANEQSRAARDLGTAIHGDLERFFQGKIPRDNLDICIAVKTVLMEHFGYQEWSSEKSFSSSHGFGGKVDLHSDEWVVDFKTKDFGPDDMEKKFLYDEHGLQLSAYRLGLGVENANLANVFISVREPGLIRVCKHDRDYQEHFLAVLNLWKHIKTFDPAYV